jgi:hypothetical protein
VDKLNEDVAGQVNAAFRRGMTSIPILKFPPNFMYLTEDYNAEIKGQVTHFCNGPGLFVVKLVQVYNSQTYYGTMRKHMNKYYEHKSENIPKLRKEAIYPGLFCVTRIENLVQGELWFRAKVVDIDPLTVFLIDEGLLHHDDDLYPYAHGPTGGGDSLQFPPALVGKMKLPECTLLCKIYCERPLEGHRYSNDQAAEFQNLLPRGQEFTLRPQSEHQHGKVFEIYAHLREKGGVHEFRHFKDISQKVKPEHGKHVKFTDVEKAMIGGVEFEGRRKVIKLPNIFKDEPLSKA